MALLKSYSCVKCGGVLNFDEDQEVFGCPFCGGEFAFTDFHRGDLLIQARRCLEKGSYATALDKFRLILDRNPKDFEALQGQILAEGHISAVNRLCRVEYLENAKFPEAIQVTKDAKEALPEESSYFDLLLQMFELAYEYHTKSDETDETSKAKNKEFRKMSYQIMTLEEQEEAALDVYKRVVGFVASRILIFVIVITAYFEVLWATLIFIGFFILLGILLKLYFVVQKRKIDKTLSREMEIQIDKEDAAADNMLDIRNKYMNTYIKLKRIVPDPKAYEKPLPQDKKTVPQAADPFINIEQSVVCNKCGGQLSLDKEKNLYECRSCGVAYGASLFFGDPLKKAKKALKDNDFAEAEQRFAHFLMLDPHNCEALLGRILTAGKWKMVIDIELTETPVNDVRMRTLKERASEAVTHVSEEDKPFMEDLHGLINLFCDYESATQEVNVYSKRLEYISKNRRIFLAGKNTVSPLEEETDLLVWRRSALLKKQKSKAEFKKLRDKVLQENAMRIQRNTESKNNG